MEGGPPKTRRLLSGEQPRSTFRSRFLGTPEIGAKGVVDEIRGVVAPAAAGGQVPGLSSQGGLQLPGGSGSPFGVRSRQKDIIQSLALLCVGDKTLGLGEPGQAWDGAGAPWGEVIRGTGLGCWPGGTNPLLLSVFLFFPSRFLGPPGRELALHQPMTGSFLGGHWKRRAREPSFHR